MFLGLMTLALGHNRVPNFSVTASGTDVIRLVRCSYTLNNSVRTKPMVLLQSADRLNTVSPTPLKGLIAEGSWINRLFFCL